MDALASVRRWPFVYRLHSIRQMRVGSFSKCTTICGTQNNAPRTYMVKHWTRCIYFGGAPRCSLGFASWRDWIVCLWLPICIVFAQFAFQELAGGVAWNFIDLDVAVWQPPGSEGAFHVIVEGLFI